MLTIKTSFQFHYFNHFAQFVAIAYFSSCVYCRPICCLVDCIPFTHRIEVVQDPDFSAIVLHVVLHKVAFYTGVHVFLNFLTIFLGKCERLLKKQVQMYTVDEELLIDSLAGGRCMCTYQMAAFFSA